jgi:predicted ester cyclase
MGASENLEIHARWAEAQANQHDLSQHEQFVHPDIVIEHADGKTVVGLAAMRENMEANYAAMPDWHMTPLDRFATDDRVVLRWRVMGTPTGELFGMAPTGEPIEIEGVSIWEFVDGKAKRGWVFSNAASLRYRSELESS